MKRILVIVAAALLALIGSASAQDFPTRNMTMVIPFAAGGPTDLLGRVIAQRMGEILGQTVVVENVGGAGGMTGSKRVADAKPDGYTFLLGTVGTHAQGQTLYKHPLYNAMNDFTPVATCQGDPAAGVSFPSAAGKCRNAISREKFILLTQINALEKSWCQQIQWHCSGRERTCDVASYRDYHTYCSCRHRMDRMDTVEKQRSVEQKGARQGRLG